MDKDFAAAYWLDLSLTEGVGGKTMRTLLAHYGSPRAVLAASVADLRAHVGEKVATAIRTPEVRAAEVDKAVQWLKAHPDSCLLTLADEMHYPRPLLETDDPPALLYARGDLALLHKTMIAVVGSRSASAAGLRNTEIFSRALSDADCCVVSGLAQGVDTAAHKGALKGSGGTVAVVGTGMDIVYPRENRQLAAEICQRGLLLGEFPLGTKPLALNFPRRNRIISGLVRACLVMESTLRSGSLITARLAAEQGREVFAVPGSINSPMHRGCHQLIKQGARLAENVNDILEELKIAAPVQQAEQKYEDSRQAGEQEVDDSVLSFINYQPTTVDDIAVRSGIAADALMPALLELEMNGKIVCTAGGCFQRV